MLSTVFNSDTRAGSCCRVFVVNATPGKRAIHRASELRFDPGNLVLIVDAQQEFVRLAGPAEEALRGLERGVRECVVGRRLLRLLRAENDEVVGGETLTDVREFSSAGRDNPAGRRKVVVPGKVAVEDDDGFPPVGRTQVAPDENGRRGDARQSVIDVDPDDRPGHQERARR